MTIVVGGDVCPGRRGAFQVPAGQGFGFPTTAVDFFAAVARTPSDSAETLSIVRAF
jgi:hypothetical protein